MLNLAGVQEVRWDKGGTEPADDYTFCYENGNAELCKGTDNLVHKGIISVVKSIEFLCNTVYTQLVFLHREHFTTCFGAIAPSSGHMLLRKILYYNAFTLSLRCKER
jgi:hypothetical protein